VGDAAAKADPVGEALGHEAGELVGVQVAAADVELERRQVVAQVAQRAQQDAQALAPRVAAHVQHARRAG
jgi:hypothetical protein